MDDIPSRRRSSRAISQLTRDNGSARRAELARGRTFDSVAWARLVRRLIKATAKAKAGDCNRKHRQRLNQIRYRARRDGYGSIVDGLARALDVHTIGMIVELGEDGGVVAERFAVLVIERNLRSADALTLAFRSVLEAVAAERMLRRIVAGRAQPHDEKLAASLSSASRLDLLQALALQATSTEEEDPRDRARRELMQGELRRQREERARQEAEERQRALTGAGANATAAPDEPTEAQPKSGLEFLRRGPQ